MNGWIKIHRQLIEKPIWLNSTAQQKVILITLLTMANHEENEWDWGGKEFKVTSGQFITSLPSIAKRSGKDISIQNVRTALERFEKLDFLTDQSTAHGRLITIKKWDTYQGFDSENQQDDQQTGNRRVTSNKNDKNIKNISCGVNPPDNPLVVPEKLPPPLPLPPEKPKQPVFIKPTPQEVFEYMTFKIKEKNLPNDPKDETEAFYGFYESKNWMVGKNKMKDWKATIYGTWVRVMRERNFKNNSKQQIQTSIQWNKPKTASQLAILEQIKKSQSQPV